MYVQIKNAFIKKKYTRQIHFLLKLSLKLFHSFIFSLIQSKYLTTFVYTEGICIKHSVFWLLDIPWLITPTAYQFDVTPIWFRNMRAPPLSPMQGPSVVPPPAHIWRSPTLAFSCVWHSLRFLPVTCEFWQFDDRYRSCDKYHHFDWSIGAYDLGFVPIDQPKATTNPEYTAEDIFKT